MVVSNTTLRNQKASQKGRSLPFPLVAGRSVGFFYMVQQPWFLASRTHVANALYNHLYLTRWKERGTIRFILELVHNLASALALRALSAELGNMQVAPSLRQLWNNDDPPVTLYNTCCGIRNVLCRTSDLLFELFNRWWAPHASAGRLFLVIKSVALTIC